MPDSRRSTPPHESPLARGVCFRIGRTLVVSYLVVVVMLSALQRKLIYLPTREASLSPLMFGLEPTIVQAVTTQTSDGLQLNGWHWAAHPRPEFASDETLVVLYFHGNGGHRCHREPDCRALSELGAEVVIFDYRGYGDNPGSPSESGLALDARAAWDYVTTTRGVSPNRIVLHGGSLGGGVAIRLAAELCDEGHVPAGLVLRSTFASMTETAAWHYPWLPVRLVLIDRYPSDDRIHRVTCPLLQFHGTRDRIVPLEHGRRLFELAAPASANGIPRRFVELPNADHNDVLAVAGREVMAATRELFADIRRRL